jgi:hypothetical protein
MPLASSRSAAEKRAKDFQEEKAKQERKARLSLPRHSRSGTRVTDDSAKRRRHAREASEERSKKLSKSTTNDTGTEEIKVDPEAIKENRDSDMGTPTTGTNKRDAPEEEQQMILSPTPYWKVRRQRQGCLVLSSLCLGVAHKEEFHRSSLNLCRLHPNAEAAKSSLRHRPVQPRRKSKQLTS